MTASSSSTRRKKPDHRPQAGWRSRDILKAAAIVAGVYLALQLLWVGRSVFLLGFLGGLLGLTMAAGVDRLQRLRIPRGLGAVLIVLAVVGTLTAIGFLIAPEIGRQMRVLRQEVPQAVEEVRQWVDRRVGGVADVLQPGGPQEQERSGGEDRGDPQARTPSLGDGIAQQLGGAGSAFFSIFSSTLSALAGIIVLVFVSIFVATDPGLYHRGLMHLFPHRARRKAGEVLTATATTLRRWLVMQMLAMLAIGILTTVALLVLEVRAAVALGFIAGFLEFIPYVGPILSAVPAIAMALLDGPEKALYVVIAYTVIQQLEGVVLQPLLMKEGLELPPVLTILGQGLFAIVFGFLGLMLAVPLLATAMVPVKMLYVRDVVGDQVTIPGQEGDA